LLTYLALHYWAGAGHEYDALRSRLPAGTQLLAPDLPGFGDEATPAGFDYSVDSYADWVAGCIEEQQLTDYVLVGHSMGGKIVLALAARQPAGLRGLVLFSPSPPSPEPLSDKDRASCLAAYGKLEEAEKTLANITDRPLRPEVCAQIVADNLRTTRTAWNAWLEHGSKEDISSRMSRINVPCRVLVGEVDRNITPEDHRRQTLPLLPAGTPFTVVPGAGHLLPYEAPKECVASFSLPFEEILVQQ
jgi:pimeloyl-ACP methyl ester carboxylesterase